MHLYNTTGDSDAHTGPGLQRGITLSSWLVTGSSPFGEFHSGSVANFKRDIGGHRQEKTRSVRA